MSVVCLDSELVLRALPMVAILDSDGQVTEAGQTLAKLSPGIVGRPMAAVLRFVQPAMAATPEGVARHAGRRLRVMLPEEARGGLGIEPTVLRGVGVPLLDGRMLINFTFGADPTQALRRHRLTAQDFFETDPAVDFLFLQEAHAVVLAESRRLNDRIDAARALAEEEAATDKLTGLRNRRAMDILLDRLRHQDGAEFGLMNLDLDFFKSVNDTFGHGAGDRVLEEVGIILHDVVRRGDMVARVGGDEFMLVFADTSDVDRMRAIAGRIIEQLERPIEWNGRICRISGSIGITMSSFYDPVDPARMIADADDALYACKRAGRARYGVVDPGKMRRAV